MAIYVPVLFDAFPYHLFAFKFAVMDISLHRDNIITK